ncbi:MAG TPA: hypothetical protein PK668_10550 [Myxococcota bacterium]|nr:hypothetical protein [Myxococcota bacterium]HRY93398.1 hypothetical protein [Myxococcota bacterium]HSA20386.1 hypothetical protein [Myxococcota bacterium]
MSRTAALVAGLLLAASLPGCGQAGAGRWVAAAEAALQRADAALGRGDLDGARAAMLEIVRAPAPDGVAPADARAIRQDAGYLLAGLELEAGRPAEALAAAEQGLALGRAEEGGADVFEANLHIVRGRALEALGRPGDAAAAYHRALLIQERLLAEALGPDAGGGAP